MGITVYAEGMGFFHKGSGGKGVAPGDVCLSPPPPPGGPLPVPYVNVAKAGDLTKATKTVKIDGQPTALESSSEVSTSTGDEGGTQGGGIVTHKTKGKASFTLWSFVVKAENKGVARHGDLLNQNTGSTPPNIICPRPSVKQNLTQNYARMLRDKGKRCPPGKEDPPKTKTTRRQRKHVRGAASCWSCGKKRNMGVWQSGKRYNRGKRWVADHQPPQSIVWKKLGGCRNPKLFEQWKKAKESVQPQCAGCSSSQGGSVATAAVTKFLRSMGVR